MPAVPPLASGNRIRILVVDCNRLERLLIRHRLQLDEVTLVGVEHERGRVQNAQLGEDVCLEKSPGVETTLQGFRIRDLVGNVGWVVAKMRDHWALLGDVPALMRDG